MQISTFQKVETCKCFFIHLIEFIRIRFNSIQFCCSLNLFSSSPLFISQRKIEKLEGFEPLRVMNDIKIYENAMRGFGDRKDMWRLWTMRRELARFDMEGISLNRRFFESQMRLQMLRSEVERMKKQLAAQQSSKDQNLW